MDPKQETQPYLLVVWDDVEPDLMGPFETEEARDAEAKATRNEFGPDHGIFYVEVSTGSKVIVRSYSGAFFETPDGR